MSIPKHVPHEKPAARAWIAERLHAAGLRPLRREALDAFFVERNPAGWPHDVAALGSFLDNFGLLAQEQLEEPSLRQEYLAALAHLVAAWSVLPLAVVRREPWWGKHLGVAAKGVNGGDPRPLIRFLRGGDWAGSSIAVLLSLTPLAAEPEKLPRSLYVSGYYLNPWGCLELAPEAPGEGEPPPPIPVDPFKDFSAKELFSDAVGAAPQTIATGLEVTMGGVHLPLHHDAKVSELLVLDPSHATSDLPLRVGLGPKDIALQKGLVRDQGHLKTSVAHAIAMALDLQVRRRRPRTPARFSPAWVHARAVSEGDGHVRLADGMRAISDSLPCGENEFPHAKSESVLRAVHQGDRRWATPERLASAKTLTRRHGLPLVKPLDARDVAELKLHLASGWAVLVATTMTREMTSVGFHQLGIALTPLIGQRRQPEGQAWLLVGYDHWDDRPEWRYQGAFVALCSWGKRFPAKPVMGAGLALLPFALVASEGVEAFALRLRA